MGNVLLGLLQVVGAVLAIVVAVYFAGRVREPLETFLRGTVGDEIAKAGGAFAHLLITLGGIITAGEALIRTAPLSLVTGPLFSGGLGSARFALSAIQWTIATGATLYVAVNVGKLVRASGASAEGPADVEARQSADG